MYRIGVSASFSAAHYLKGYEGSCERIHGHNYRVEAVVEATELDGIGLGLDFRKLRQALEEILKELDHRLLNECRNLGGANPSTENIARIVYGELAKSLAKEKVAVAEVRVWETPETWASYRPGGAAEP